MPNLAPHFCTHRAALEDFAEAKHIFNINLILPLFLLESTCDFLHIASFVFYSKKQDENLPIAGYKAK